MAMTAMLLSACGGSSSGGGADGVAGSGGKGLGGASAKGGTAGTTAAGGSAGGALAGSSGATGGAGGDATGTAGAGGQAATGGVGGAPATGGTTGTAGAAGAAATGGTAGTAGAAANGGNAGSAGGAAGAGQAGAGGGAAGAPGTTIPATAIDFGPVDCGTSGGTRAVSFTNTGTAPLHYRATVSAGGPFSLQNGVSDGSVSGDVAPSAQAIVTVVAGVVPTTSAAGAVIMGTLSVTTNATGAESTQIAVSVTAQGGTCTLNCGSFAKCSPTNASPYCANTQTDNANCGTCAHACGSGEVCNAGLCTLACGALSTCTPTNASPYCANVQTDNANCGACGHACPSGQVCSAGACTITCGGLSTCSPTNASPYCANLQTDGANCGTCGHGCAAGQSCMSGSCQATCASNEDVCGGTCTNTTYDPNNCGACGTTCAFPQGSAACLGGNCVLAGCSTGYLDCNHDSTDGCEVNKNTSAANCGACGAACALGETCNSGICTANLSAGLLGYWNMDDAFGSTAAHDSGPNHLDGLVNGPVTFVPGGGKQGSGAISLGGNAYIRVPFPNDALNDGTGVFIPQGNMTFSMWFKTSASAAGGLQVIEGSNSQGGCDRVIGNGGGGNLQYNSWSEVNMSGATSVNDGNWHLVTYVLDETSGFKAYIDGVLDVSTSAATGNCGVGCSGFNWAVEYWIGRSAGCRFGADYFVGLIDDVRIYDHVLSPTAVAQLYNTTK